MPVVIRTYALPRHPILAVHTTTGPRNKMLTGAVGACLMTSALHYLEKAGVDLRVYMSNVTATTDKTRDGLAFTGVSVKISIAVADEADVKKARKAVLYAEKACPVSNGLRCPVRVHVDIRSPGTQ